MSRTDKDRPHWIADEYRVIHHWKCIVGREDCDLPDKEISCINYRRSTACYRMPIHARVWWQASVPSWFINHVWNAPERQRARIDLQNIAKEYNATGEVSHDFQSFNPKNQAKWYYW